MCLSWFGNVKESKFLSRQKNRFYLFPPFSDGFFDRYKDFFPEHLI